MTYRPDVIVRFEPARTPGQARLRALLHLLYEAGWRCCFCLCQLDLTSATREHMQPRSMGGSNKFHNLTVSCLACNSARGVEDFWAFEARTPKRPRAWGEPIAARVYRVGEVV